MLPKKGGGYFAPEWGGATSHQGVLGRSQRGPKWVLIFKFFGNYSRMDRNGLQTVQNASKPHFSGTHKTAERGQNVPNFDQKGLSQGPHAACKCWQSAFMHFASARQQLFFLSVGWAGGFPAHDLGDCLTSILVARYGIWCCAHFIHGLPAYTN